MSCELEADVQHLAGSIEFADGADSIRRCLEALDGGISGQGCLLTGKAQDGGAHGVRDLLQDRAAGLKEVNCSFGASGGKAAADLTPQPHILCVQEAGDLGGRLEELDRGPQTGCGKSDANVGCNPDSLAGQYADAPGQ
jgi:hypothetical protein